MEQQGKEFSYRLCSTRLSWHCLAFSLNQHSWGRKISHWCNPCYDTLTTCQKVLPLICMYRSHLVGVEVVLVATWSFAWTGATNNSVDSTIILVMQLHKETNRRCEIVHRNILHHCRWSHHYMLVYNKADCIHKRLDIWSTTPPCIP